jgi:hypothetical protein
MFEYWETPKLGEMLALARLRLREAQARFEASGEAERRMRKRTFEAEQDAEYVRRAQDTVEMMRAELRRRAVEATLQDSQSVNQTSLQIFESVNL